MANGAGLDLDLWIKKFLLCLKAERAASSHTLRAYQADLACFRGFLERAGQAEDLGNLRQARLLVREFWVDLGRKRISNATIIRRLAALRSFFTYLVGEDALPSNPFQYIEAPKKEKLPRLFLSEKEMSRLLESIKSQDEWSARDRAIVELIYSTGIRIEEAMALNVEDLDLWNGMARVLGQADKERTVPLGDSAAVSLRQYLNERRIGGGAAREPKGPLFLNARGSKLGPRGARLIIKKWVDRLALGRKVNPRMLRNSFAMHLLDHGCDLKTVQEMMGHKNISSTQAYARTSVDRLKKVYDGAHPRA